MSKNKQSCPKCQSKNVIPIMYGDPTLETLEKSAAGKLAIGGCCVNDQSPKWHCQDCEHEFGQYMLSTDDLGEGGKTA